MGLYKELYQEIKDVWKTYCNYFSIKVAFIPIMTYVLLVSHLQMWWSYVLYYTYRPFIQKVYAPIYYCFKYLCPWTKARIYLALDKYMDTTMYRDRCVAFGQAFAIKCFADHDYGYFLRKITPEEKRMTFWHPYKSIEKYKPTLFFNVENLF